MPRTDFVSPGLAEELVVGAARTVSGDSGAIRGWGAAKSIRAQLNVSAASGTTPTLNVTVEDTLDGTNWNNIGTFAQKVAAGIEVINITTLFSETIRLRWVIAGTTPSFTFSINAYSE